MIRCDDPSQDQSRREDPASYIPTSSVVSVLLRDIWVPLMIPMEDAQHSQLYSFHNPMPAASELFLLHAEPSGSSLPFHALL